MSRPTDPHLPPTHSNESCGASVRRATTIVLLDPTSPDGHSGLSRLRECDTDVLLVVLLSGRASNALREFAHHHHLSVSEAGWIYLDQVAVGLEATGRTFATIGTIASAGPDTARSLADIAIQNDADRVVLPSSILRLDPQAPARLARLAAVTVVVPEYQAAPAG